MKVSRGRTASADGRFDSNRLVDESPDLVAAQRRNHAFDLPPVAKARDIALITAALGTRCGFIAGIVAKALHQLGRVGKRGPSVDEERVHVTPVTERRLR